MLAIIFEEKSTANTLVLSALNKGLILFWLLWNKKAVRISPPLNITEGEIKNKAKARLIRDGAVVYTGEISSIFREKNQVKEVKSGLECGISLKDFIDFKEKDVIEAYLSEKIDRQI